MKGVAMDVLHPITRLDGFPVEYEIYVVTAVSFLF